MTWPLAPQKCKNVPRCSQKENLVMEGAPKGLPKGQSEISLGHSSEIRADGSLSAPARVGVGVAAPASHDERAASSHERAATTLASDFDALHDG